MIIFHFFMNFSVQWLFFVFFIQYDSWRKHFVNRERSVYGIPVFSLLIWCTIPLFRIYIVCLEVIFSTTFNADLFINISSDRFTGGGGDIKCNIISGKPSLWRDKQTYSDQMPCVLHGVLLEPGLFFHIWASAENHFLAFCTI